MAATALAQDKLVGLTSIGGSGGYGTAFSMLSNGTGFFVHNNFFRVGTFPEGALVKGSDGNFYGTASGDASSGGIIFKMTSSGNVTIIKNLTSSIGFNPKGLVRGKDSSFYGMTYGGGSASKGTVFKVSASGVYTVLKSLDLSTGYNPLGSLVQGKDGNFYGMTSNGGTGNKGTIFKVTASGTLTVLKNLDATTGTSPEGSLIQASDGNFYGMTKSGGSSNSGTIFKITPSGTITILKDLVYNITGSNPSGNLIQAKDGDFYGMTNGGGSNNYGTVFKITSSGVYTILKNLDKTTGTKPYGSLVQGADGLLYGMTWQGGTLDIGTIFKITTSGTLTVLKNFDKTSSAPYRNSLIQDTDGTFYGMNSRGGLNNNGGTIFKITPTGTFSLLVPLPDGGKGVSPQESLFQGTDGYFYGTALQGGSFDYGAIYKLCTSGTSTPLHSFDFRATGASPRGSLIQSTDGNFYGMTSWGGAYNYGTIFKVTPSGTLTVLKHLSDTTGQSPEGSLIQATDGAFYGMTNKGGGSGNAGTIFKITSTGTFTLLKKLDNTTGNNPYGSLVQGKDGLLYGMTNKGGASGIGTVFKMSTSGSFTLLNSFTSSLLGSSPYGNNLIQGLDSNFYGMTLQGGSKSYGVIFKMTPAGAITVLKSFDGTTGKNPQGSLVQGSDSAFYGMTRSGGTFDGGTIFKITTAGVFTILRHLDPATDGSMPLGSLVIQKAAPKATPQSVTAKEDTAKVITLTGTGGLPLTYTITTAPKNGTLTGTGANCTYKGKANFYGKDSFYFAVTWGCQPSAPAKVLLTIGAVNDAPVLAPIGNKTIVSGSVLSFTATATDVDAGQTKTFTLITPPSAATIGAGTGAFSWKPTTAGAFTFKVRVTDNGSPVLYDEETITVTVTNAALTLNKAASIRAGIPEEVLSLFAVSNPTQNYFTLRTQSNSTEVMQLRIINEVGQVIELRSSIAPNSTLPIGHNYRPGVYYAEAVQGNTRATLKLIKATQ